MVRNNETLLRTIRLFYPEGYIHGMVSNIICPARIRKNMVNGYTVEYPTEGASLPDIWLA